MRNLRSLGPLGLLGLLGPGVLAACVGEAPPPPGTGDGDDDPGDVPAQVQRVSGKALDYFVPATALQATLTTDGIDPPRTATSATDGAFAIDELPVGSQLFFSAARAGYRPTRNLVAIADAAVVQDVYLMSTTDINRQYATAGKTPVAGRAFVVADLQRNNGTPLAGVPLTSIKLVDAANAPVAGVLGPYIFGATGDIAPAATQTETHGGKTRVAFLDVPAGRASLQVTFLDGAGQQQTLTTPVTTVADGATLVRSGGTGGTGGTAGGTGGGGGALNPRFTTDVFPRLQTAANGGRGCANCHTVGGLGAIAVFNALPTDVLAALKAKPGLLNLTTPADSLLLSKPLYEAPPALQNHPNATFVDANDPDYKLILLWIQQGAQP
jgi:hypothetical protein